MIIVPSKRFIEVENPEVRLGVAGYFTVQAVNRFGRATRERTFHNLITDLGMNRLATTAANQTYTKCHVGLGTATPAVGDTQLANFLANMQSGNPSQSAGFVGSPDYYAWRRLTWETAIGALGTVNLTELGVSGQNTNGGLFSRELFRDSGGTPAAFPITDQEALRVTYELRFYVPQSDSLATILISGNSHDTITRASRFSSKWIVVPIDTSASNNPSFQSLDNFNQDVYTGDLQAFGSASTPTGNLGNASSVGNGAYVGGSFQRDFSATWGTGTGNGSIRTALRKVQCAEVVVRYDPVIAKTSLQQLILNQRFSWSRA